MARHINGGEVQRAIIALKAMERGGDHWGGIHGDVPGSTDEGHPIINVVIDGHLVRMEVVDQGPVEDKTIALYWCDTCQLMDRRTHFDEDHDPLPRA